MADALPRLAIITGAASGLGRAFCRQVIAAPGSWYLVAVDLDQAGAEATLAELRAPGRVDGQCECFDVADDAAWTELRRRLQVDWPRLDLLVNCAGVCISAEVGEGDLAAWRRVHEVNYLGVLNGCHVMTPWLKRSVSTPLKPQASSLKPALINVASIMGVIPAPALGAYCASKAAVIALSEAMYAELRPHGVNVTVAAPGFFATALLDNGEFASPKHREQADAMVRSSVIDADSVACETLNAARRGRLYAVMGRRARWYWRLKRAAPMRLLNLLSQRYEQMMQRGESVD